MEGCARNSQRDLLRFLDISFGSVRELNYYVDLSLPLKYMPKDSGRSLSRNADEASRVLPGLVQTVRRSCQREPKNQETGGFIAEPEDGSTAQKLTAQWLNSSPLVQRNRAAWTAMASADSRRSEDKIGFRR